MAIENRYILTPRSTGTSPIYAHTDWDSNIHVLKQDADLLYVPFDQVTDLIAMLTALQEQATKGCRQ